MDKPTPWMLSQVVLEVRFQRGVVYLDRCGSLTLRVADLLGKPFEASLPSMEGAELNSAAERLTIRYGTVAFSATQSWVRSPVRVELLAPGAWDVVASGLDVGDHVTRVGARFVLVLDVKDADFGQTRIVESGICAAPTWGRELGRSSAGVWTFDTGDHGAKMRVGVAATDIKVTGGNLPSDLSGVIPAAAVFLDFEHVLFEGDDERKLTSAQLKDFVRNAWQSTKKSATQIRSDLGL